MITSSNTATVSSDGTATENAGQTTRTTTTTTTNNNTVITTIAEAQQPEQNETAEQYREKCISAVYNYDRFSANYTFSKALNGSELIRYSEGKIKLDNSSMTGEFTQTKYGSNGNITSKENQHYSLVYAFVLISFRCLQQLPKRPTQHTLQLVELQ